MSTASSNSGASNGPSMPDDGMPLYKKPKLPNMGKAKSYNNGEMVRTSTPTKK